MNESYSMKPIMSFKEAIEFLDISKSFLYKLVSKQEIPYSKPNGKLLYFKTQHLIDWALSNMNGYEILEQEKTFNHEDSK